MKVKNIGVIALVTFAFGVIATVASFRFLGKSLPQSSLEDKDKVVQNQKLVEEESVVIDVVEKVSPSVVSIAVENRQLFNPFGFEKPQEKQSGIATGFVVKEYGLILTNKHVVSAD